LIELVDGKKKKPSTWRANSAACQSACCAWLLQRNFQAHLLIETTRSSACRDAPPLAPPKSRGSNRNAYRVRLLDALKDNLSRFVQDSGRRGVRDILGRCLRRRPPSVHRSIRWYGGDSRTSWRSAPPLRRAAHLGGTRAIRMDSFGILRRGRRVCRWAGRPTGGLSESWETNSDFLFHRLCDLLDPRPGTPLRSGNNDRDDDPPQPEAAEAPSPGFCIRPGI